MNAKELERCARVAHIRNESWGEFYRQHAAELVAVDHQQIERLLGILTAGHPPVATCGDLWGEGAEDQPCNM